MIVVVVDDDDSVIWSRASKYSSSYRSSAASNDKLTSAPNHDDRNKTTQLQAASTSTWHRCRWAVSGCPTCLSCTGLSRYVLVLVRSMVHTIVCVGDDVSVVLLRATRIDPMFLLCMIAHTAVTFVVLPAETKSGASCRHCY